MEKTCYKLWISLMLASLWACTGDEGDYLSTGVLEMPGGEQAVLLYGSLARQAIMRDTAEGFFEQVPLADLQLQMKRPVRPEERSALLEDYRFLLSDFVRPYQKSDMLKLRAALQEAYRLLTKVGEGLFPERVEIIKVQGHLYGPQVFYTREGKIIIPAPALQELSEEALTRILLHELFHIYSRYRPEAREALYRIIGFEAAEKPVLVPDSLEQYRLLNPDGINWQQKIRLQRRGQPGAEVVFEMLTARNLEQSGELPYFRHIGLSWHPADSTAKGWEVQPAPVPLEQFVDFAAQTGGNTDYILHPDEILADNFVLLALGAEPTTRAGQRVLDDMAAFFQSADNR